jgi:hypothetical protein
MGAKSKHSLLTEFCNFRAIPQGVSDAEIALHRDMMEKVWIQCSRDRSKANYLFLEFAAALLPGK